MNCLLSRLDHVFLFQIKSEWHEGNIALFPHHFPFLIKIIAEMYLKNEWNDKQQIISEEAKKKKKKKKRKKMKRQKQNKNWQNKIHLSWFFFRPLRGTWFPKYALHGVASLHGSKLDSMTRKITQSRVILTRVERAAEDEKLLTQNRGHTCRWPLT